jgi:hypothetical protein
MSNFLIGGGQRVGGYSPSVVPTLLNSGGLTPRNNVEKPGKKVKTREDEFVTGKWEAFKGSERRSSNPCGGCSYLLKLKFIPY